MVSAAAGFRFAWRSCAAVIAVAACSATLAANGPADEEFVVVKAGKVVTGAGDEITGGEIVIVDGKVRLVGRRLEYPKSARIFHAESETVMPGMVHCRTRAGLPAYQRSGVHGDYKAADEVFPGEMDLEPYLRAGYTAVCIYPAGTGVTGVSSVCRTAGEDGRRRVAPAGYLRVTMNSLPRDKQTLRDALKKARSEIEKVDKARQEWEAKKKEAESKKSEAEKPGPQPPKPEPAPAPPAPPQPSPAPPKSAADPSSPPIEGSRVDTRPAPDAEFKPPEIDPAHRPLVDLIQKKEGAPPLLLEVSGSSDVLHALDVLEGSDQVTRMFSLGGGFSPDFNYVVPKLGEQKATVVAAPAMHRLPATLTRYNLVAELFAAGAEVALVPDSDSPADLEAVRGRTADLVRAALPRAEAIRGLTANPAKVAGVGKTLGTIEKGKDADLVFLDGDVLDPAARVTRVMVLGKVAWKAKD